MTIVSSTDFDNVATEIGETVTIYAPTQTFSTDYDSVSTSTLGSGTNEKVIVQPAEEGSLEKYHGKLIIGDVFMMFKSLSIIARDSLVLVTSTSKYYRVVYLEQVRISGAIHHYESILRFIK